MEAVVEEADGRSLQGLSMSPTSAVKLRLSDGSRRALKGFLAGWTEADHRGTEGVAADRPQRPGPLDGANRARAGRARVSSAGQCFCP